MGENFELGVTCEVCGHRTAIPELMTTWIRKDNEKEGVIIEGISFNDDRLDVVPLYIEPTCVRIDRTKARVLSFAELREYYKISPAQY